MSGWLAKQSGVTAQQIQGSAFDADVREDVMRRLTARAVVVLRLCALRPDDLDGLHYLELMALDTARTGLTMLDPEPEADPAEPEAEDLALAEMIARATGGA